MPGNAASAGSGRRRSVLIFNFFGGILKRGIPLYVDNLTAALEREGYRVRQLRCPGFLRGLPSPLLNVAFVMAEQVVMPVAGLWHGRAIYPYNSMAVAGGMLSGTAVVVHDFISSRGRNRSLAARYIRLGQAVCAGSRRDVIYISGSTRRIGRSLGRFSGSRTFLFPNSFYCFMRNVSGDVPPREDRVLLCSGWGGNKDLAGALKLYRDSGLYRRRALRILGLAGRREPVERFTDEHPELAGRVEVMPQVGDREVARAYERAAWTWVHSLAEGYGRSIAEARICGSRVVASNIPPFREQTDEATRLYRGLEEFKEAVEWCETAAGEAPRRAPREHEILQREIQRFMNSKENDDAR